MQKLISQREYNEIKSTGITLKQILCKNQYTKSDSNQPPRLVWARAHCVFRAKNANVPHVHTDQNDLREWPRE